MPSLGVVACAAPIQKGGTGTHGEQESRLAAHEPDRCKQPVQICDAEVDVNAGRHDPGAVKPLDESVISIAGVRAFEPAAVSQTHGAAWQKRELPLVQPPP